MSAIGLSFRFNVRYNNKGRDNSGDFSLDVEGTIPSSGITGVFGQSGSGKTTLLRCIAGLQKPDSGELTFNDDGWQSNTLFLPSHKRPVGYVFQEANLFPHLNAVDNLRFAVKRADTSGNIIEFDSAVDLLGIEKLLGRYPHQLSGGERQRVAIARALLINPRLILMDEPLASLDAARKREILPYLERLHRQLRIPILYVSHSLEEISRLADHLLVLDNGRLVANGPLKSVLSRLDLPFYFNEDRGVVIEANIVERESHWHLARLAFAGGELWVRDSGDTIGQGVRVRILAKDVSLALQAHRDTSILNLLEGRIVELVPDDNPATSLARVKVGSVADDNNNDANGSENGDVYIVSRITQRSVEQLGLEIGKSVWMQIKSAAIVR